ncbi:MAG: PEGA domain-containing protein [Candidatus Omnitrophica bacterium]|nr:PEGA domain-containing protein [Candidatus Omnitrophota bacterium]
MPSFQKARSFLFYLSLISFFVGLPFIIASALGYKFNPYNFKFIKTGLIYIKTHPEGARIYLNGKLVPEKSPASITELTPGVYKLFIELENYYPWKAEVDVEAGKALRLDKIILFSLRPNLGQLNRERFSYFKVDSEKKIIYYLDLENRVIYRSGLDGSNFEDIANLPENFPQIIGFDFSPDRKKMFIFSQHQVSVISFDLDPELDFSDSPLMLEFPREKIINVFWHSDSYHLVVLTNKHVLVIESKPRGVPINLIRLNKEDPTGFYDQNENALYFSDSQRSPDGTTFNNLYKLELNTNLDLLDMIRKKSDE